ncbi:helix-turn-helix transcriptional regulator [Dictyobacter kobayashii]|uniref:AraC family transcriptional regulator n=1 Tax=Dictyobacter kobayashii TaxID=2014872 RepID=A0A402AU70_9CHLR|nr:AraC family transcriptional regulator [Dictyobacter kobayashii]GCE22644.1 AraC family transcriptional regulator [Dictyobacter kobayashii]
MLVHRKFIHTQPTKALWPRTSQMYIWDQETRIDLPFSLRLENLIYIGVAGSVNWHVRPHYHDHFEMCYVDEGQGCFAIDDCSYAVKQGDVFLTLPGEVHQGGAAGDAPFRLYYIGFQLEHLSTLELDYYQLGMQRVVPDGDRQIKALFDAIFFKELQQRQSHALEMVQSLFLSLLVSLLRIYEQGREMEIVQPVLLSPALKSVLQSLHTDLGRYQSIDALAVQVNLSRSHLTREFKRAMGISLGQYARSISLQYARFYLRETSDSVSAIAERLHFTSIHTFSIFFKRHTGMSPQEYRKLFKLRG